MSVIKYTALLLVLVASVIAQDCRISVQQQQRTSYRQNGVVFSVYDVRLRNDGSSSVSQAALRVSPAFDSSWEVVKSGDNYQLPAWRATSAIAPGAVHQFGYIIKSASPAQITIVSCGGQNVVVNPTAAPTTRPSSASTTAPTTRPASPTTAPATAAPATSAPATQRPTTASTTKAPATARPTTVPSTRRPTTVPTTKAPATTRPTTKAATTAPTTRPTTRPTTASTTKAPTNPTNSPSAGGKVCPTGTWWQPAPLTTWQWVISTTPDTSLDVQMYDIDLFSASPATIKALHDAGRAVICYFSTQYEDWRPDAKAFPSSALGNNLDDWKGEKWVDIRNSGLRNVMKARLDLAASKGCDGVEPDNVDGYKANTGFPLTAANQLEYNKFLAAEAHARGLSIGLKNDLSQVVDLQPHFDWAINEECYQYNECPRIKPFIDNNKAVFSCEYKGSGSTICPYMNGLKYSSLIKELKLDNNIKAQCCTYLPGGCSTKASYRCVSQAQ